MKRFIFCVAAFILVYSKVLAQTVDASATLTRDIYGDQWFPEWNTEGNSLGWGYRNSVLRDPTPATWTAIGNKLTMVRKVGGLGEDRWSMTSILVFAQDNTGQWVRFGLWNSTAFTNLTTIYPVSTGPASFLEANYNAADASATVTFSIPDWARGEMKYEIWAEYGAASKLSNWEYNPDKRIWVDHLQKSHLTVYYGDSGVAVENVRPQKPNLEQTLTFPSGNLTASPQQIDLGGTATLTIVRDKNESDIVSVIGDALDVENPSNLISVTPATVGTYNYALNIRRFATLRWGLLSQGHILKLFSPKGDVIDVTHKVLLQLQNGQEGVWKLVDYSPTNIASDPASLTVGPPATFSTSATILVKQPSSLVTVSPQAASYTVHEGAAVGRTYPRSWSDGSAWHAYLGREGVSIGVQAMSSESSISTVELQAKAPTGDWADLAAPQSVDAAQANGPGVKVSQTFSVRLGTVRADKPLIPSDPNMAGVWQLRARALDGAGHWTAWSAAVPLSVEMPLQTVTKTGQTLPPLQDAAWFNASATKTYTISLWIP